MEVNKFYFTISLSFNKDCNLDNLEKQFGIKAYKKINLNESKAPVKQAKLIFKTDEFEEIYTDEIFEKFVLNCKDNFKGLKEILNENDGVCYFNIVFTSLKDKPCLSMNNVVLTTLSELGASFDVDFI